MQILPLFPVLALLPVFAVPAAAQWERQAPTPYPNAHQPWAIDFAGSRGFITGINNFPFGEHVLMSTDAGVSWRKLFDSSVNTVHFADALHGWMVGGLAAFRTIDGGASWLPMNIPPSSYLHMRSLSASFVWAMNTPWASGYPVAISDDGGQSWRTAQLGANEIRLADFATPLDGIGVYQDGLARTTDGGRTWTPAHAGTGLQDARMLDAANAVAIRDTGMITDGELLQSSDGGRSWSVVLRHRWLGRGDDLIPIDASRVLARFGTDVWRSTDAGRTWAPVPVGYNTGVGPSCIVHVGGGLAFVSSSFGEIFRSDDAGARWQKVFDGYAGPLNAFAFADATTGCAAGNYGAILRTTDAGRSWSFASNGLTLPNLDLAMWDRQRGIALADNGFKLRVSDGEAWIPQPYTSGNQQSDVAVCVLPGGFAATCGRTQVHVSQDYGRTWTAKTPVVGGQHGIRFLTPDLGWVVGEALRVTHTDDGGKTWKVQHEIPSRHVLYSIDMLDPTHGWTSGSGGAVLKTTDGRTWQSVPVGLSHPGATQGLLVDFVTPQAGWLVGQFGLIATTANGGGQWTERSLIGFDESFTAITAVSADEAYAAVFNKNTLGSRLLHSTDNGRSWQTVWAGSDSVTRIERSPANELWLCGTRGMIVHREPGGAFEPIGAGCSGSAGVPALSTAQPPRIGATFDLIASRLPAAATSALLMLGVSRTRWSGLDLPLDLAFLGMSGCALRVSRNVMLAAPAAGGTARWLLQVPNSDSLLGQAIHLQALVVDPPANAAGLVVSDAATGWVGR